MFENLSESCVNFRKFEKSSKILVQLTMIGRTCLRFESQTTIEDTSELTHNSDFLWRGTGKFKLKIWVEFGFWLQKSKIWEMNALRAEFCKQVGTFFRENHATFLRKIAKMQEEKN